ncbi:MAG: hypothetical protein Kow0042_26820 [Calditrichia bacterium]
MKRLNRAFIVIMLTMIPIFAFLNNFSEIDDVQVQPRQPKFPKPLGVADEAMGVLDKGQLQNLTMNYGQITDTRYEDVGNAPTQYFYNFRYPRKNFTGVSDDFSLFFALRQNSKNGDNGNVIDGWTDNDNEDWIAKDGSYGKTHYNANIDPTPHEELKYPPDNPTTPYLAHSDLPNTWPEDENGEPFWPGYFRRNPATGEEFPGEFASDRDVYAVFDDSHNQMGNPVGIEVEMMAYCYGRPYADKFQFYEFFIHNKSGKRLDSCWVGYYNDPDCSDYGEEILILPDPDFSDPNIPDIIMQRDIDGDKGGATRPTSLGTLEDYSFGMAVLETPKNVGVTTFHYFSDPGPTDDKFLWPIIINDPTDPDIASFATNYFHGSDPRFDDVSLITERLDLAFIVASGPFDLEPGEMVKSTIVVAIGDDDADFYKQIDQAVQMFEFGFIGPTAPPAPALHATTGDASVTLYWDDRSEHVPDAFSGEIDFEGYRIYRSEDNGQTWGKEVIDSQGNLLGYVPLVQFDLANGITGTDPHNPISYLGDDTGLRHTYVDNTVKNGITYSYTIVAYDRGDSSIYSLESARGTSVADRNFITVTPTPDFLGKVPASLKELNHLQGNGKGEIIVEVVDDNILKDIPYEIRFHGSPAGSFDLWGSDGSQPLLSNVPINVSDNPVVEGFQVSINSDMKIGGVKSVTDGYGVDVYREGKVDSSGSWYVSIAVFSPSSIESRSGDYEIRFTEPGAGAMVYSWGPPTISRADSVVNIEVWDVSYPEAQQICFQIQDDNNNKAWDEGETIFIVRAPYPDPQPGDPLVADFPANFPYQVKIINAPTDTLKIPPQPGDVVRIESFRSFTEDDIFQFSLNLPKFDQNRVDLSEIRVVPNPYIVGAAWEQLQNVHQVRFMYLPPECTINIYTLNGEKVNTIRHNNYNTGDELFNLVNFSNQALAFGVYVYVVSTPDGKSHVGKFAIIR